MSFKSYSLEDLKNEKNPFEPIEPESFTSTFTSVAAGGKTRHYANIGYKGGKAMFETAMVEASVCEDKTNDSGKSYVRIIVTDKFMDSMNKIQEGLVPHAVENKDKFKKKKMTKDNWANENYMRCIYKYPKIEKDSDEVDTSKDPSFYLTIGQYSKFDIYKGKKNGVHQWDKNVEPESLYGKTLKCKIKFNIRSLYQHASHPIGIQMYISNCNIVETKTNDGSMEEDEDLLDFIDSNNLTGVTESATPTKVRAPSKSGGTVIELDEEDEEDEDTEAFLAENI